MILRPRSVWIFALGFVPPFMVAVWLYPSVLPGYQRAVFAAVNSILGVLSPLAEVRADLTGQWRILVHRPPTDHVVTYALRNANIGLLTFFQQVVLSALLLATPVGLKQRLRLLASGVGVMFCLHVSCVAGCAYGMAFIDNAKSPVFRSLPIILGPFASGLAVVAWSTLTWRYWLAPMAPATTSKRVGRNL